MATVSSQTWQTLIDLAYEGLEDSTAEVATFTDRAHLSLAYSHCRTVTARNSRSFFVASSLLPADKRRAVRALYAFCRVSDDLVDKAEHYSPEGMSEWRGRTLSDGVPPASDLVATAWLDTRTQHCIPQIYAYQLLDGVERDLRQTRYQTFEDLASYCYSVAATVGLMSMHIIGFSGANAIPYAVKLGIALQMTNILRDVGEDWRSGRVYLPEEELHAFRLTEADLAAGQVTNRWRKFMDFQIARTRALYKESMPGIELLHRSGQHAIAAAATIYGAILSDIEMNDYDVFNRRSYVRSLKKMRYLVSTWWGIHRPILTGSVSRGPQ